MENKVVIKSWVIDDIIAKGSTIKDAVVKNKSKLCYADLKGADLRETDLREANFIRAMLDGACFASANLAGADFRGAYLRGTYFRGNVLGGANLAGADFRDAYLRGTDFRGTHLVDTDFRDTYLRGADFTGATIKGTNFRGADFTGANFHKTNFEEAIIGFKIIPSLQALSSLELGKLSDPLTLELMRRDAFSHPHPEKFDDWADGGVCPYKDENLQRTWFFKENKDLWEPGNPTMRDYDLIVAICEEKGWGFK